MMLSDDEQRTLDSTAALLAHDDPELAAALAHHTLPPRRRSWRPRSPGWPPLIVVALVLALLIVPGMIVDARDREPAPVPGATSGPGAPQSAAPPRSATPQEPIQMRTMAPGSSSTPASGS